MRERTEILLREYETCQQNISFHATRYWAVVGIFMAVSTAALGGLIYGALSSNMLFTTSCKSMLPQILAIGTLIVIFGLGMIVMLVSLKRWIRRINWLIFAKYFRMREIESQLGMAANWMIDTVDQDWNRLSPMEQNRLARLHERHEPPLETRYFITILYTLVSLWGVVIVGALIAITKALVSVA
jgi:hypothetical protein